MSRRYTRMEGKKFKIIQRGKRQGILCKDCNSTSWEWDNVYKRYCPSCKNYLETSFEHEWRNFKETPEYRSSPCPFPPKRLSVGEKIESRIMGALMLVGGVWMLSNIIIYIFS